MAVSTAVASDPCERREIVSRMESELSALCEECGGVGADGRAGSS